MEGARDIVYAPTKNSGKYGVILMNYCAGLYIALPHGFQLMYGMQMSTPPTGHTVYCYRGKQGMCILNIHTNTDLVAEDDTFSAYQRP